MPTPPQRSLLHPDDIGALVSQISEPAKPATTIPPYWERPENRAEISKDWGDKPEQLKMLMTPKEILGSFQPYEGDVKVDKGETLDTVMPRKLAQTKMPWSEYSKDRGMPLPEHIASRPGSMFGDLASGKEDPGMIHLSHQFGSRNQPQIAGAHHRLAALEQIAPDKLLPVQHHMHPIQAIYSKGYT